MVYSVLYIDIIEFIMMNDYEVWSEVFLNWNLNICTHYNKKFLIPLSLTCKSLNKTFTIKNNFECDICYFRDITCKFCIKNNTKYCIDCVCYNCDVSVNLTGSDMEHGCCGKCIPPLSVSELDKIYVKWFIDCYNMGRMKLRCVYVDDVMFLNTENHGELHCFAKSVLPEYVLDGVNK